MLAVMSKGSAGTTPSVNALTGWTEIIDEAIVLGLYAAVHVCDGTEGSTVNFTLSSATRGAWIVYEISGAIDPATILPQIGTTATGSSVSPNPPNVNVTGGSKDVLAIAFFGRAGEEADDDTWVTAAPTSFTNLLQKACGTAGTNLAGMVASAERQVTASAVDPAVFTCATGAWRANTIVVHPAPVPKTTTTGKISLASSGTPDPQTSHSIKVRARVQAGAGTLWVALYEGASNRSGDLSQALTTSLANYELAISDANAANITSYSNLDLWIWGVDDGSGRVFEIDYIALRTPVASAPPPEIPDLVMAAPIAR